MRSLGRRAVSVALAAATVGCGQVAGPDATPAAQPPVPVEVAQLSEYASTDIAHAVSPRGRSVIAWLDDRRIWSSESDDGLAWRPARALLAEPRAVEAWPSSSIAIELDDEGNGLAAWMESHRPSQRETVVSIVACRYESASGWGPPVEVHRSGYYGPQFALAVDPDGGHAILAWRGTKGLEASVWDASGWSSPESLASDWQGGEAFGVRVRGGQGVVTWGFYTYTLPQLVMIRARTWNEDGGWSAEAELARGPRAAYVVPRPAVDSSGTATVLWGLGDPQGGISGVRATRHEPGRGWQPPDDVGRFTGIFTGIDGLEAHKGDLLTALWSFERSGETPAVVAAMRYVPGQGWQSLGSIAGSRPAPAARSPELVFLGPGGGLWMARPGGTWGLESVPSDPACPAESTQAFAQIGVDASGARTVVWLERDCLGQRILAWRATAKP
jgi:hypothetical protein